MIITCEKCATRFTLDEFLLDAAGSKVRCSRCQHIFTAFPPPLEPEFDNFEFDDTAFEKEAENLIEDGSQETFQPEKLELETIDPDEIETEFKETDTAAEDELDLSEDLDEKEPGISDQKTPFPLEDSDPLNQTTWDDDIVKEDALENDEQKFDGLDEFDDPDFDQTDMDVTDSSDTPFHEPPPPRRPARASLIHPLGQEDELTADEDTPPPQKRSRAGLLFLVVLVLFLLSGGGYVAATFFGYKIPFLPEIQIPFIHQYLPEKTPESVSYPDPIPDQKSVTGRFITNDTAGELFIITGKIENPAQIPYRRVQVKGTLFQKEQKAVMSQTVFCGNILPEETLRTSPVEELTAQLRTPREPADINDKIMPGETVPFMLVFSDLPQNLENFTVEVAEFENTDP
ncbi:MAG: DUF3426 domain-containing protein [Desulfotignum sp.]|nr:DUF3426 domain-containing protein [Desulfotignum sp.]